VATSGFDITIDAGEGFVGGWCARDSQTIITVPGSTTSTVVLAWSLDAVFDPQTNQNRDLADEVRVDLATNVDPQYPKTELFDVTTDSSTITSTTDRRRLGPTISTTAADVETLEVTSSITDPVGNTVIDLSQPIRVTEEAATFTESNVTVTNNGTEVSGGSISLSERNAGSTATRASDSGTRTDNSAVGLVFLPNTDLDGIDCEISANTTGATRSRVVLNDGSETVLDTVDISALSPGDRYIHAVALSSGVSFRVVLDNKGSNFDGGVNRSTSPPIPSADIDITDGCFALSGNQSPSVRGIKEITGLLSVKNNSGDAVIAFDSGAPADIESYDLATFQRTLDSETLTVDVEDGTGTVLFSDIDRNFDISGIDTSTDIRFRANLSRNDSTNDPSLDFVARRFVR
jgi:hypothetical protein